MRTEKEILELIVSIAKNDDRILAVIMVGSRANEEIPKDKYQDFDIAYIVNDVKPFYNNMKWIEENFGKPLIFQLPEDMSPEIFQPIGDGHFTALMIFNDGIRIDLTIDKNYDPDIDKGEPAIILLDKIGLLKLLNIDKNYWYVKPPTPKLFYDCCNEFWWCLNNVVKGIARDELPYAMNMYNCIVRDMLDKMIEWYVGVNYDFSVSTGKNGKYFRKLLPKEIYEKYKKTYSDSEYSNFWDSLYAVNELFHITAEKVAKYLNVEYNQNEEDGMIKYMNMIRNDCIE
ncbi:MAG: aminoglycoside 6-adenylyltransferase [Oscillospiraceae bacterium]|jgi:aminoglycoside 6-adenylyltransferase|nr:aminoglycoside 6-adenylyltransferase [Oscillospiraceae bacterium]